MNYESYFNFLAMFACNVCTKRFFDKTKFILHLQEHVNRNKHDDSNGKVIEIEHIDCDTPPVSVLSIEDNLKYKKD